MNDFGVDTLYIVHMNYDVILQQAVGKYLYDRSTDE